MCAMARYTTLQTPSHYLTVVQHHLITIKEEVAVKLWPWLNVKHIKNVMKDPRAWEHMCSKLAGTKITGRLHIAYQRQNKLSITVFLDEEATVSDSE